MEIHLLNNSLLCNSEILDIIQEKRASRPSISQTSNTTNINLQLCENIEIKLLKYFDENNIKRIETNHVNDFINELNNANISFTKAEIMVLLNHLPTTPVEIYLIIEECAERLSDDQVQYVLDCIQKYFH